MSDETKTLLAVERAMTPEERASFLGYFVKKLNPHLHGARVADVLGMLLDSDAYLEVVEPMHEAHGEHVPEPYLLTVATLACVGIYCGGGLGVELVNWQRVAHLVERVRDETPRMRAITALTGFRLDLDETGGVALEVHSSEAERLVELLEDAGLCIVDAPEVKS